MTEDSNIDPAEDNTETKTAETEDSENQSEETQSEETQDTSEETSEGKEEQGEVEESDERDLKIQRQAAHIGDLLKAVRKKDEVLKDLQNRLSQLEQPKDALKEPVYDDYENNADFLEAVRKYEREKAKLEVEKEFLKTRQNQENEAINLEKQRIVNQQEKEYIKNENPSYIKSKQLFSDYIGALEVDPYVENAITEQAFRGNIPKIIDYFAGNDGENLGKLSEISKMRPTEAAIEIYKIQQTLTEPQKKEVKQVPKPIQSPKGLSKAKTSKNMSGKELLAWVNS